MADEIAQSQLGPNSWQCLACGTRNLAESEACRTCGAPSVIPQKPIQTLDADELFERFGPTGVSLIAGRYRLLARIGSGSTGSVFKALDVNLGRTVAIKVLSTTSDDGMDINTRFLRLQTEGQVLGRLKHKGLVTVFDMGNEDGILFIVMEYIDGKPLNSFMTRGHPIQVKDAVAIMVQVCAALHHVHKRGAVHRDLKPSNIIVSEGDVVKISDFGLAKAAFGAKVLEAGLVVGTPYYMSPEQLRAKEVDHRADIFSAGIVLYEMVTGYRPFDGENLDEIVRAILAGRFIKASQRNILVPSEIDSIITKALKNDREQRYFSMGEFGNDLRAWQSSKEIGLNDWTDLSFDESAGKRRPAEKASYSRKISLLVAFLLILVSAVTFWTHFNSDEYLLKKSADRILDDFSKHRFEQVYEQLSDDFKLRHSIKEFDDLPYLGFFKTRWPDDMIYSIEKLVFFENHRVANVIISFRYADSIADQRYTMRWVKEHGEWRFQNPEYENYLKMFDGSKR
ncbi:MAG: protein kinase [Candidatus Coatesbacteria bacterium]|nr:protein kinase [Candidatus Coatesbacteria bacterium]